MTNMAKFGTIVVTSDESVRISQPGVQLIAFLQSKYAVKTILQLWNMLKSTALWRCIDLNHLQTEFATACSFCRIRWSAVGMIATVD